VRTVKAFSNEEEESKKFSVSNKKVYEEGKKRALYTGLQSSIVQVSLYLTLAFILLIAKQQYRVGKLKIGAISSFMLYIVSLIFQFWIMSYAFPTLMGVLGSSDRLVSIMNYEVTVRTDGKEDIEDANGCLEVIDVKFKYPTKQDVLVLKGVSLATNIKTKRVVALCGSSGCGKSSIIQLIERFYDPTEGKILFNGRDIRELDTEIYHQQVGIVQ
jgi:ATP-binding cassette subfamily B protein